MVVVSLCDAYRDSPNCRLEAQYAIQQHKPLLFLKLQVLYPRPLLQMQLLSFTYPQLSQSVHSCVPIAHVFCTWISIFVHEMLA